ncbi:leucine-rich repeat protein [Treponema denticola]|uniref:leucine-rich repeat domain-containing protein n=1 Tax=Treponema denticola TaxID=158 RepID=UPI0020A54BBF|nr:leucine-rich repeat domain-containing protein [Treponema denticola]UTD12931.1 leucine-rich repeat protein [Treponema denticola]
MKQNLRRAVNLTALVLAAGLLMGLFTGCQQNRPPAVGPNGSNESSQPTTVTITVEGDTNVTVNEPKTIEVAKGTKWSEVKLKVKVSYTPGYEAAGFKLDSESGPDLEDSYSFNTNKTIFVLSRASIFKTDGGGTITGCNSGITLPAKLVIPSKIGSEVITKIGNNAFSGCTNLKELELPNTLTEIGRSAFDRCPIETLVINCNITSSIIANLTHTNSVTNNMTTLIIGEGIKEIGSHTTWGGNPIFDIGNKLKKVKLPESLTSIGFDTFCNCGELVEINFPPNLEAIAGNDNWGAFRNCKKLSAVDLSSCTKLTYIGSKTFFGCTALTGIDLSFCKELGSIGYAAFEGCTSLKQIKLPEDITYISMNSFKKCKGLTKLDLSPYTKLHTIEKGAFGDCTGLKYLSLPQSLTQIGDIVSGGATDDGYGAFINCTSLTSVDLSGCKNLKEIDRGSFKGCTGLTSVIFANTTGWTVYDNLDYTGPHTYISPTDLKNHATAAEYLRETYADKFWKKN